MSDATAAHWEWALAERRQTDSVLELFLAERLGAAGAIAWIDEHPYPELPFVPDLPEIP